MNTPSSAQILKDDAAIIAGYQHIAELPLAVKSAHGCFLVDADGKEYLDFTSGACTMCMGYDRPQCQEFGSFPFPYASGAVQVEYAKALARHFPGGGPVKVGFGICGSEAVDGAIKLCRAFTKRSKIVSFAGDYHGTTYGAASLTSLPGRLSDAFGPMLEDIEILPFCDETASDEDIDNCLLELAYLDYESIAGFIIEPIQGDMGMLPMHQKLMQSIYGIARTWGIAFVVDEVQMAFGRTGPFFSIENYDGIIPDAVVVGKTMGGGIPLSAIIGNPNFMDSLGPCEHAFSMAGTAEACARGLAMLQQLDTPKMRQGMEERSSLLYQSLYALQEKYPEVIEKITGIGYSFALWIKSPQPELDDDDAAVLVIRRCFEQGLYLMRLGANWLRIQPQFNIPMDELQRGLNIIAQAVADLRAGKLSA